MGRLPDPKALPFCQSRNAATGLVSVGRVQRTRSVASGGERRPCKVAEKYVNQQLSIFIEVKKLLHRTQSGFRPLHSTESALLLTSESIRKTVDRDLTAALLMLGISAAFDTVSCCERLWSCGVGYKALQWLASFLQDRIFQVS
ncbi:hypothetical protein NDU88_001397 [Pleurodeles waltl]|uniref:Reverse transcriptase domain-containing protein n=1 Tax=Pleurodeles waltl TaxID=8319 RepID=A0AAV7TIG3_PLEWA|nr:hypothetical protein NDU88_001397 [Pleurodeles waltl]